MEIIWKYNLLETVAVLFLIFFGGIFAVRWLGVLWVYGKFKNWW